MTRKHLLLAVMVLLLAVLLPALAYYVLDVPPPPTAPLKYAVCEECKATSKVHALLRSEQVPLISEYLEVYGDDPFPQQATEPVAAKQIYGQAITQELLQKQAGLLVQQIDVLDRLHTSLLASGVPTKAEMGCLQKEAARIERAFGKHVHVLWVQTDPAVNELPDPVVLVAAATKIHKKLSSRTYFRASGKHPWDQEFSDLLQLTGVK